MLGLNVVTIFGFDHWKTNWVLFFILFFFINSEPSDLLLSQCGMNTMYERIVVRSAVECAESMGFDFESEEG